MTFIRGLLLLAVSFRAAHAQSTASCSSTLTASYPAPSVAEGYTARLVATGLSKPRGIKFDSDGHLLVVEQEVGITALTFSEDGQGCISEGKRQTVIADPSLNHGIELSEDGKTLYASNPSSVYSWDYTASSMSNTSEPQTLVTNMTNTDHTTRTLLLSRFAPGLLVVTRGSTSNIDPLASDIGTGHSQIRAFNITNMTAPYQFESDGLLLGWGLRNDVGIDEEPVTGGLYSVENSVDQMERNGQDIHLTNPAEEMNFLGYLNGTASPNQGRNFGYPECYAAWDPKTIPAFDGVVGDQFVINDVSSTNSDSMCSASERQSPRLSFHPHMAPLDILFNNDGNAAWITFHGSWDSQPPIGYKLSVVQFDNGEPVQPSTSTTAAIDVVSNADLSKCPDSCFRPVGLAWNSNGNLFMSSDATGEIYVIKRSDGSSTNSAGNATGTLPGGTTGSGGSGTGSSASPSSTAGASATSMSALAVVFGAIAFFL